MLKACSYCTTCISWGTTRFHMIFYVILIPQRRIPNFNTCWEKPSVTSVGKPNVMSSSSCYCMSQHRTVCVQLSLAHVIWHWILRHVMRCFFRKSGSLKYKYWRIEEFLLSECSLFSFWNVFVFLQNTTYPKQLSLLYTTNVVWSLEWQFILEFTIEFLDWFSA